MELILLVNAVVAADTCYSPIEVGDQTRNLRCKLSRVSSFHRAFDTFFGLYLDQQRPRVETKTTPSL